MLKDVPFSVPSSRGETTHSEGPMTDTPKKRPTHAKTKDDGIQGGNRNVEQVSQTDLHIPPSIIDAYEADQTRKNRLERWRLALEAATLVAVVTYTVVAYHQWDTTRQALTANERPWLAVDLDIGGNLEYQKKDGSVVVPLIIKITNLGKAPAQNIMPRFSAVVSNPVDVFSTEEKIFKYVTEAAKVEPRSVPSVGRILFPGKDTQLKTSFVINSNDTKAIGRDTPKGFQQLMIVGCVAYKYAFDKSVHRTGLVSEIGMKPTPDSPNVATIMTAITKSIQSRQLKTLEMLQGWYAD